MSTLMMALVAGLTVGSDTTERISTVAVESLCIAGIWEGTFKEGANILQIRLEHGRTTLYFGALRLAEEVVGWVDEGRGRFRMHDENGKEMCRGIYKREAGRLILCYRGILQGRPCAFSGENDNRLIILQRVQPPK